MALFFSSGSSSVAVVVVVAAAAAAFSSSASAFVFVTQQRPVLVPATTSTTSSRIHITRSWSSSALLSLSTTTSTIDNNIDLVVTGPDGKPAVSKEEDLELTLKIILNHDSRSTTVTKEQYIQQQMDLQAASASAEQEQEQGQQQVGEQEKKQMLWDVSVPYDAAAKLAYEGLLQSDKSSSIPSYEDFERKYLEDAVALVKKKQEQRNNQIPKPEPTTTATTSDTVKVETTPSLEDDDNGTSSSSSTNDRSAGSSKIYKGTVKWFDSKKGYGFLTITTTSDDDEKNGDEEEDIFVHQTAIKADGFRALQNGQEVEFQIIKGDDGRGGQRPTAMNVTGPNGEPIKRGFAYKKKQKEGN